MKKKLSDMAFEPLFDANLLLNDYGYRYEIVGQFMDYMKSLENTNERLGYFLRMTEAMGFELNLDGGYSIYERPYGNYDGRQYTDIYGKEMARPKNWFPHYLNKDLERGILIKAYFQKYINNCISILYNIDVIPLSHLLVEYHKRSPTKEYIQNELDQTVCDIKESFECVSKFLYQKAAYERSEGICKLIPENLKNEEKNIEEKLKIYESRINDTIKRIEREILGTRGAINWSLFYEHSRLNLLVPIWIKIEYKLFLEQQLKDFQSRSVQGKPDSLKKFNFDNYVDEKHRVKLMPFLISTYKGQKAQKFGLMVYALHTLGLIDHPKEIGDGNLYEGIKLTFNVEWDRQALNYNINLLNKSDKSKEIKIKQHAMIIKEYINESKNDK